MSSLVNNEFTPAVNLENEKAANQNVIREKDNRQSLIPGDLGQQEIGPLTSKLLAKSYRMNELFSGINYPVNNRYQGQREATKFLLTIQSTLLTCANLYFSLSNIDGQLANAQLTSSSPQSSTTPTQSEIALIGHLMQQMKFREWLLMRDSNYSWFS